MSEHQVDFALFGSTILTRLLAGLLASVHGKSVLMVGESQARFRLARGLDISVAPVTRPQTWELLESLVPETIRVIGKEAGRRSIRRVDPILFAETLTAQEGLSHIRHMALAFGHAAERLPPGRLGPGREGVVFRDAVMLDREQLEPELDAWLDRLGVRRTGWLDQLEHGTDGSGTARRENEETHFRQAVLCDDAAIAEHFVEATVPLGLSLTRGSTLLSRAPAPLAAPVMHQLDNALTLVQSRRQGLLALGSGGLDSLTGALAGFLGDPRRLHQIGQAEYAVAAGSDGAPVLGTLPHGPTIIAGLGPAQAFFAPALARALCGVAKPMEEYWFAMHAPGRDPATSTVSEWKAA